MTQIDKNVSFKTTNKEIIRILNDAKNQKEACEEGLMIREAVLEHGGIERLLDILAKAETERDEYKEKFFELALNYSKQSQAPMMAYQPQAIPAIQPVVQPVVQPEVKIEPEEVAEMKESQSEIKTDEVVVEEKSMKRKLVKDGFKPTEDVIEIDEDDEANEMLKDSTSNW